MKKKVIVLGAGMVGSAMAVDLCRNYEVTIADINKNQLDFLKKSHPIKAIQADLSDKEILQKLIRDFDLVVGALPGFMGFKILKNVIKTGKNIVDISFFDEDPFQLDTLAKHNNVTAVVDCGVAPGMSNMILGYHNEKMKIDSFECLVGGLPFKRTWPYQYKAPFSPIDVLEEYTRPARVVENGEMITKPALSEPEYVEFEPVGTLEAFNTDGLRTLLKTMTITNMKEKTLRYPGHIEIIKILRETGLLNKKPLDIYRTKVRPLDLTAKLLFPKWKLDKNEPEFTIMRITIKGKEQGKLKKYVYNLFDKFDPLTKVSSMARTTGYTCTAVADLVLEGDFDRKGISPPEFIGKDGNSFKKIMEYLKERNINYEMLTD